MADEEERLFVNDILVGMQTGSGNPIFLESSGPQETEGRLDAFGLHASEVTSLPFKFSNDVMIIKTKALLSQVPYYNYYQNVDTPVIETMLKYNYNMTIASVDAEFTTILSKITQELVPPKTSRTFAYDFKFSQNQNASITTGSVRPASSRTARTSGGGGY